MNLNRLRQILFNNLGLKVVSLLLAGLLWFQVASQQVVQRTIPNVPVDIVNLPKQYEISNEYSKTVDMEVRVRRNQSLDSQSFPVVIDLKDAVPEQKVISLRASNIPNRPPGMEIIRFSPPNITLNVEPTGSRLVTVEYRLDGEPAPNYEVLGAKVIPPRVWIEGPASAIEEGLSAVTAQVDINGQNKNFTREVDIFLEDKRARLRDTRRVKVEVLIREKRRAVELSGVPVEIAPPDSNARLRSGTVRIEVLVPISFEGELKAEDFRALVDTSGLEPTSGWQEVEPSIILPEDLDPEKFGIESADKVKVRKTS